MVKKCGERWNSVGGTMEQCWWNREWNNGTMTVEQCGGTVEQCWRFSGTVMVEQCGGTLRWNSGIVLLELRWWIGFGGTVWWNSGTVLVEQWNSDGGRVW